MTYLGNPDRIVIGPGQLRDAEEFAASCVRSNASFADPVLNLDLIVGDRPDYSFRSANTRTSQVAGACAFRDGANVTLDRFWSKAAFYGSHLGTLVGALSVLDVTSEDVTEVGAKVLASNTQAIKSLCVLGFRPNDWHYSYDREEVVLDVQVQNVKRLIENCTYLVGYHVERYILGDNARFDLEVISSPVPSFCTT